MAKILSIGAQRQPSGRADEEARDRLNALIGQDMKRVNALIIERMDSEVELIPQLAGYLIAAGGKRLRPALTLAAAKLCGYQGDRHVALACAIEFLHTATLLHDDVVDESALRRGQDSANTVWGNTASVLVGDFLFSRAFQLMTADGDLRVLKILSDASAVIAEGEVLQLLTTNEIETGEDAYLDVIRSKTAVLFAAAAELGAVVADRPKAETEALSSFGLNLGIAFQLVDDMLDYSAQQAELGKTVGDDFREGKITLPVILAFRRGSADERAFWRRTLQDQDQKDGDLEAAFALMHKHKALDDTIARARHYGAIAKDALGLFPDTGAEGEAKAALLDTVDFSIDRAF